MLNKFLGIVLALFLICCKAEKNKQDIEADNKSVVVINIPDAEGKKLVLSVEGEEATEPIIETIKDGKAVFDVAYNSSDIATIESEYNIENVSFMASIIEIVLDSDTIFVGSKMLKDPIQIDEKEFLDFFSFNDVYFEKDKINIDLKEYRNKLFKAFPRSINVNKIDSLNQSLFPKKRANIYKLFAEDFSSLNHRLQLELMHNMLSSRMFAPRLLDTIDKKEISNIFYKLNDFKKPAAYRLKTVEYLISDINDYGQEEPLTFHDFSLINSDNDKVNLKNIIEKNRYTVLYFWFSGCGPCRSFNKKMDSKIIEDLNQSQIEFVSINTDDLKQVWIRCSSQDQIFWQNLFAGHLKVDVENAYRLRSYPTKVVFDQNFKVVDFKFTSPKDLLKLIDDSFEEKTD